VIAPAPTPGTPSQLKHNIPVARAVRRSWIDVFEPDESTGRPRRGTVRTSLPDPAHDGPRF